ncbi:MAG: hypothetical protein ACXWLM_01345 [Myxococcales bacterium]
MSGGAAAAAVPAGGGAAHNFAGLATNARFTIQLGDMASACGDLTTVRGRKKALQMLDLYPEPMTTHNANTATPVYNAALTYARTALGGDPTTAGVLTTALSNLMQTAPANPGDAPTDTALTDLTQNGVVILPGTFCFTSDDDLGTPLADKRRQREDRFYAGNPALGAFPVTIHVEIERGGAWAAAANTRVKIRLIDPDAAGTTENQKLDARVAQIPNVVQATPAGWNVNPANVAWNTVQDGARGYERRTLHDNFHANDPGGINVRLARGGLRGQHELGHVFKRAPGGPNLTADAPHHAVKGRTDASGDIKFLFCPSRVAGDRFKFQVYVDPWNGSPWQAANPKQDSGVFTVWKTIRVAGIVTKPIGPSPARWALNVANGIGLTPANYTLGAITPARLQTDLRKAYMVVRLDNSTQDFDQARYTTALQFVRDHIRDFQHDKRYDMDALLPDHFTFVTNDAQKIEFLPTGGAAVSIRGQAHANQQVTLAGTDAGGNPLNENLLLNGTTPVPSGQNWRTITNVTAPAGTHFRLIVGAITVHVTGPIHAAHGKVSFKSSSALDKMGVELFGVDNASGDRVHEIVRLKGTHYANSRHDYSSITAIRVLNGDSGHAHAGTIQISLKDVREWPAMRMPPGTNDQNVTRVDVFESPHTFTVRTPLDYNAARRKRIGGHNTSAMSAASQGWWDLYSAIDACAKALGQHLSQNATGIVVSRAISGDPVSNLGDLAQPYTINPGSDGVPALPAGWFVPTTSGVATPRRAAHVWYPDEVYSGGPNMFTYDLTSNTIHEMGHVLFLRHHWTNKNWNTQTEFRQQGNGDGFPPDHDYHDVCVMSYHHCDGDYCGRCLLKLAGAELEHIPPNH